MRLDLSLQNLLEEVSMAMSFLFGAMAQQRYVSARAQCLHKPEREFLPVIFDGSVASIQGVAFAQFF